MKTQKIKHGDIFVVQKIRWKLQEIRKWRMECLCNILYNICSSD